jgi:hypothetical protein
MKWRRCREFTGLAATKENRRRAEAFLKVIQGQIALGTFDYRTHFPHGTRLSNFYPREVEAQRAKQQLIADYLDAWQKRRSPFLPDGTVAQAADLHPSTWVHEESVIRCHLKPSFGNLRLDELTPTKCKDPPSLHFGGRASGGRCRTSSSPARPPATFSACYTPLRQGFGDRARPWPTLSTTACCTPIRFRN